MSSNIGTSSGVRDVYDIPERPFPKYAHTPAVDPVLTQTAQQRWCTVAADDVNTAFFSQGNVDAIQRQLRDVIRTRMGYVIDRQPDEHLLIIMRYVYMNESRNTGGDAEVRRLNQLVLKEVVPQVASGVLQYLAYLRDASRLPTPIPRAQATSIKGTYTPQLFTGF
jgi:hypothetical protein